MGFKKEIFNPKEIKTEQANSQDDYKGNSHGNSCTQAELIRRGKQKTGNGCLPGKKNSIW